MDLSTVFEALIGLIAALLTAVVIPFAIKKYGSEKVERLAYWVRVAVSAAEQIFSEVEKGGAEKKSYVKAFLTGHGFDGESVSADALIESEVRILNEEEKKARV